jgi:hypothetical protein
VALLYHAEPLALPTSQEMVRSTQLEMLLYRLLWRSLVWAFGFLDPESLGLLEFHEAAILDVVAPTRESVEVWEVSVAASRCSTTPVALPQEGRPVAALRVAVTMPKLLLLLLLHLHHTSWPCHHTLPMMRVVRESAAAAERSAVAATRPPPRAATESAAASLPEATPRSPAPEKRRRHSGAPY